MKTLFAALLLVPSLAAAEYRYSNSDEQEYQEQQEEMDRSSWPAQLPLLAQAGYDSWEECILRVSIRSTWTRQKPARR